MSHDDVIDKAFRIKYLLYLTVFHEHESFYCKVK